MEGKNKGETILKVRVAGALAERYETLDVFDKFSGKKIEHLPSMHVEDVSLAVNAANYSITELEKLTAFQRRQILNTVAESILKDQVRLTETLISETGDP